MKNSFEKGSIFKPNDETKMELLVAIKAFFVVFVLLRYNGS